jgi:hypothetical protein
MENELTPKPNRFEAISEKLIVVRSRINNLRANTETIADVMFGPQPNPEGAQDEQPVAVGVIELLHLQVSNLEQAVTDLEQQLRRFDEI